MEVSGLKGSYVFVDSIFLKTIDLLLILRKEGVGGS